MAKDKDQDNGGAAAAAANAAGGKGSAPAQVASRDRQYLIAPRVIANTFQTMSSDALQSTIENMGLPVLRRIKKRGFGVLGAGQGSGDILVTQMPIERGEALRASAPPDVIVEHDQPLIHSGTPFRMMRAESDFGLAGAPPQPVTETNPVRVKVTDNKGKPVPSATVTIYGQGFPAHADTDDKGIVEIPVPGPLDAVQALYVKPRADFWDRVMLRPQLATGDENIVALQRLSETFTDFPRSKMIGWGQRLMGLDLLDPRFDGAGVKIGIMDSGCDNRHPQLRHVVNGIDLVARDGGSGWTDDTMAHGTHCAGIIGARSDRQAGICGFAPGAEIHALKVFPSGRISDLIDALDVAIERQLDVLNMSLGSADPSELVQQKLQAAVSAGVACVVAAGNSSGPVQFPGMLHESITIAAVGQTGQFPADSYHAMTVGQGGAGADGIFSAKFSCFGPEVRLSGPGVAIVSTVPGGGYAAWDGTSMATPHVTGLAALILAHHPAFRQPGPRDARRVSALFDILHAAATQVVADPLRGGVGLPHAPTALAAAAQAAGPPPTTATAPAGGGGSAAPGPGAAPLRPPPPGPQLPPIPGDLLYQLMVRASYGDPGALNILRMYGYI
jgi:subtilisin family serine protease